MRRNKEYGGLGGACGVWMLRLLGGGGSGGGGGGGEVGGEG